jgi:putative resolvase
VEVVPGWDVAGAGGEDGVGTILVNPQAASWGPGGFGLYARVSSHDQRADLDRQVARLAEWAARADEPVVRVEAEVGSTDERVLVEAATAAGRPWGDEGGGGTPGSCGAVEAALSAHGRRLVVLDSGEVDDDLMRDMTEVLTSFCARLYGRRSARNRAEKALRCAERDVGPKALSQAGGSLAR